jgi:soluble lytic murein transglycosylase-like protein
MRTVRSVPKRILCGLVTAHVLLSLVPLCVWADSKASAILSRSYGGDAQRQIIGRSAYTAPRQRPAAPAPTRKPATGVRAYSDLIRAYGSLHSVDPHLIMAIVDAESGGNPEALSPKGAAGLMQLMPETAAELGVVNRFDPEENIASGTRYFRGLMDRFKSVEVALWAYNAGPGAVQQGRMPLETQEYVPRVMRLRRAYAAEKR